MAASASHPGLPRRSSMLFHTADFFAFLIVVLALFYAVPFRFGKIVLLAASYFFYMCCNPKFIQLIWALTLFYFSAATVLVRVAGTLRDMWMMVSRSADLSRLFL